MAGALEHRVADWADLPSEVLVQIFALLRPTTVLRHVQRTCKSWARVCCQDSAPRALLTLLQHPGSTK